jgi:hypothetical protein
MSKQAIDKKKQASLRDLWVASSMFARVGDPPNRMRLILRLCFKQPWRSPTRSERSMSRWWRPWTETTCQH